MSRPVVQVEGEHFAAVRDQLVTDRVASRIGSKDPTLWGEAAQEEAAIRLGWVDLPEVSRPLLAEIEALTAELRDLGLDRVVLCGMGGSSLAPEVIAASAEVRLTVLDTTHPDTIRRVLTADLDRTAVVVSSKSGTTVETDSQRRAFEEMFRHAGIDPGERMIAITDSGSALESVARDNGYRRVFLAEPTVGGRFSALSAFGLVPSALAGVDVAALLDDAAAAAPLLFSDDPDNPAMVLGAVLGAAHQSGHDKAVIARSDSDVRSFGAWVEQLVAESTGKDQRGILPVDVGSVDAPGWREAGKDAVRVAIGSPVPSLDQVATDGPLGALFLMWEVATAIAGRVIGINPFDQPNVEEAKRAARELLRTDGDGAAPMPVLVDGPVAVYGDPDLVDGASTVGEVLTRFLRAIPDDGYLALLAYLDPGADDDAAALRSQFARRAELGDRQVTFGWGPRFLHSTGQYHKGGHPNGAFLQLTGAIDRDLGVPGRPYTFGRLIAAQAAGDLDVLRGKGYPILRLHLTDPPAGLAYLRDAVGAA